MHTWMMLIVPLYAQQVNNRDISIAVLRTFISKRKQEHEAILSKKTRGVPKVPEKDSSKPDMEEDPHESPPEDCKTNGNCEVEEGSPEDPCSTMDESDKAAEPPNTTGEPNKITEGKGRWELKPPRVLEVFNILVNCLPSSMHRYHHCSFSI